MIVLGLVTVMGLAVAIIPTTGSSRDIGPLDTHIVGRGELLVTVTEQGTLESSNNTEIKCRVRGDNTIIWVVESGTEVQPGDELVRLETLLIEEEISERTKFAHLAKSAVARSQADVARAELAINEYLEGRFVSELSTLEKDLAVAEANLLSAKNVLSHTRMMAESDYASELEVEEKEFGVSQAKLNVELKETEIDVLKRFTKEEQLADLRGNLNAAKATHQANVETAFADQQRLDRALKELQFCVVRAERPGLVIYPKAQEWEDAPEIEEGATVHKDQVMLLIPDLSRMQVKVGIHESMVDRVRPGLPARVILPGKTLDGTVSDVAAVTRPAGWWTGNVVKYDTIVELPESEGLKPGMSVEVEVVLAQYDDVLLIPTTAVLETADGSCCWVDEAGVPVRRQLQLGDSNEMFLIVEAGLESGERVILDPLASIDDAQSEATRVLEQGDTTTEEQEVPTS